MADSTDVQVQLKHLQAEEARIMRELQEIEEKARVDGAQGSARAGSPPPHVDDPDAALASLLADCEKEVRDAKGYIADDGPPLHIVRLRPGETGPKGATFLSRPRNTGVDFTIPVTLKAYTDVVRNPIFLNDIRDKIRARAYTSSSEYLDDMRLLHRNTVQFNKGPDLAWVVQHAKLLLDAAEDAVESRLSQFRRIEASLHHSSTAPRRTNSAHAAKRKRPPTIEGSPTDGRPSPPVGSFIEVWWGNPFRRWYVAEIMDRAGSNEIHLRYTIDDSTQWVALGTTKWRIPNARQLPSAKLKRPDHPPSKKRKVPPVPSSPRSSGGAPINVDAISAPSTDDFDAFKQAITSRMDDLASAIKDQMREHLDRTQTQLHRSDHLQRVLFVVQDAQGAIMASVDKLTSAVHQLRREVAAMKKEFSVSAPVPSSRRVPAKGETSSAVVDLDESQSKPSKSREHGKNKEEVEERKRTVRVQDIRNIEQGGSEKPVEVRETAKIGKKEGDEKKTDQSRDYEHKVDKKPLDVHDQEKKEELSQRQESRDGGNIRSSPKRQEPGSGKVDETKSRDSDSDSTPKKKNVEGRESKGSSSDEMEVSPVKSSVASSDVADKSERDEGKENFKKDSNTLSSGDDSDREGPERKKEGDENEVDMGKDDSKSKREEEKRKLTTERGIVNGNQKDRTRESKDDVKLEERAKKKEKPKTGLDMKEDLNEKAEDSRKGHEKDDDSSDSSDESDLSSSDGEDERDKAHVSKKQALPIITVTEEKRTSVAGPRPKVSRFAQAPDEGLGKDTKGDANGNGKRGGQEVSRNGTEKNDGSGSGGSRRRKSPDHSEET